MQNYNLKNSQLQHIFILSTEQSYRIFHAFLMKYISYLEILNTFFNSNFDKIYRRLLVALLSSWLADFLFGFGNSTISKSKTRNRKLEIENSKSKTRNRKLEIEDSKSETRNRKLEIENSKSKIRLAPGKGKLKKINLKCLGTLSLWRK